MNWLNRFVCWAFGVNPKDPVVTGAMPAPEPRPAPEFDESGLTWTPQFRAWWQWHKSEDDREGRFHAVLTYLARYFVQTNNSPFIDDPDLAKARAMLTKAGCVQKVT